MSKPLTYEEAVTLLDKAVEDKGADYVYPRHEGEEGSEAAEAGGCMYREDDGSPSCIVGHVIAYAGGDLRRVPEGLGAGHAVKLAGLSVDETTETLLIRAQMAQDSGASWGMAVGRAKRLAQQGLPFGVPTE